MNFSVAMQKVTQVKAVYGADQLLFLQRTRESCKQDSVVTTDQTVNVLNKGPLPHVHRTACAFCGLLLKRNR